MLYAEICPKFRRHNALPFPIVLTDDSIRVIIKIHALFCYYAIKRQISTKLIRENMFCIKAHQPSIVLPSKNQQQVHVLTISAIVCL
jgi:hypothetical protein